MQRPITRATLQYFCGVCLQELLTQDPNLPKYNSNETSDKFPQTYCHSCCFKISSFQKFRYKTIASTAVLRLLLSEQTLKINDDGGTQVNQMLLKLKNLCRICLQKNSIVCPPNHSNEEIKQYLYECTGLRLGELISTDILTDDPCFPQFFCKRCYSTLLRFVEFRALSTQTIDYLQKEIGLQPKVKTNTPSMQFFNYKLDLNNLSTNEHVVSDFQFETEPFIDVKLEDSDYECELPMDFLCNNESESNLNSTTTTVLRCVPENKFKPNELEDLGKNPCSKRKQITKAKDSKTTLKCEECNKSFYKKFMYDAHIKGVHEGVEKPFNCQYCQSTFKLVQTLNRHMNDQHIFNNDTNKIAAHVCPLCQKSFKRKEHLKEHIYAVHDKLRPYKCKVCGKSFGTRNTQIRHERNHSNEKKYSCEFCEKRYNFEGELKVHLQRHTTNSELLCPICKRGKSSLEELQQHIAMHEASRQHQCQKCGKIFKKLYHLKEHDSTVHLKLRPFKCKFCARTFGVRKTLKNHELRHDPTGKTEFCTLCQLYFQTERALQLHIKKTHSEHQISKDMQH